MPLGKLFNCFPVGKVELMLSIECVIDILFQDLLVSILLWVLLPFPKEGSYNYVYPTGLFFLNCYR